MAGPLLVSGFLVRIGPVESPGRVACLATAGHRLPIVTRAGGSAWAGVAVSLGGAPAAPVATADGSAVLLAGEVYNRERVAAAIDAGSPAELSDAELVLHGWLRYGVSIFRLLNGRFAAVVSSARSVVLATDHAGTMPLYVRVNEHGVEAASEAKALAAPARGELPLPGAEPLPGQPGPHRIPAGTAVVITGGHDGTAVRATAVRIWAPPHSRAPLAERDAVRAVRDHLAEAVHARVAGDPTPTVVLSGGIDSSGVAAHARASARRLRSACLGTDTSDEFAPARAVADHLGTEHTEVRVTSHELVRELPWAVWAAEVADHTILEYLLPLVALYRRLANKAGRVLTGYGADIPLGGMHRLTERLGSLDELISHDMATFDGLNEMSPTLSGIAGVWSTHPYWDREVLSLLVTLEPGLKRRHGRDKWVLRESLAHLLPAATVARPKLGIHEGSGLASTWSRELTMRGVPAGRVTQVKSGMARRLHTQLVLEGMHPSDTSFDEALASTLTDQRGSQP